MINMIATIETTAGNIRVELMPNDAPNTVKNFTGLATGEKEWTDPETGQPSNEPFYNGLVFHRVIDGFMIQGGGFEPGMKQKPTGEPIQNEATNGLKNEVGTVAMARTQAPHSATAQFFINIADNAFLNHRSPDMQGWGYCVFGRVTEGMEVVDKIKAVPTGSSGFHQDVPLEEVVIERVEIV